MSRRSGVCASGSRLTPDEWSQHGLCAKPTHVHGEKTGTGKKRVKERNKGREKQKDGDNRDTKRTDYHIMNHIVLEILPDLQTARQRKPYFGI